MPDQPREAKKLRLRILKNINANHALAESWVSVRIGRAVVLIGLELKDQTTNAVQVYMTWRPGIYYFSQEKGYFGLIHLCFPVSPSYKKDSTNYYITIYYYNIIKETHFGLADH